MSIYGKRIKEARERAGMSVETLAFSLGWSRPRLSNFENEHRTPSIDAIKEVAEALKVPLGEDITYWLITGEDITEHANKSAEGIRLVAAIDVFHEVLADAVDYGRIKLDPTASLNDFIVSFSTGCSRLSRRASDRVDPQKVI